MDEDLPEHDRSSPLMSIDEEEAPQELRRQVSFIPSLNNKKRNQSNLSAAEQDDSMSHVHRKKARAKAGAVTDHKDRSLVKPINEEDSSREPPNSVLARTGQNMLNRSREGKRKKRKNAQQKPYSRQ